MTVKDKVRGGQIITVTKGTSVRQVAEVLADNGIGAVPVMEGTKLVGIFSERDLLSRVVVKGLDLDKTRVDQVMTKKVVSARADDSPDVCLQKMQTLGCRHLPIMDGKSLVGFLSIKDLLTLQVKQRSSEIRNMKWMMWAESVPSADVEVTWRCGECRHKVEAEVPPIRCPRCQAARVHFSMVPGDVKLVQR